MHTGNKLTEKLSNKGTLPSQHIHPYSWDEWENVSLKRECKEIARKDLLSRHGANIDATELCNRLEREITIPSNGMLVDDLMLQVYFIN